MSPAQTRWCAIVLAASMLVSSVWMFDAFGLAPWSLLAPVLVLGVACYGPTPRLTPWRDALLVSA